MATPAAKNRQSSKGRRRSDAPRNYWTKPAGEIAFGREEFRFVLSRRKRKLPRIPLDELVEGVDWGRQGSILTAEMNLRRPVGKQTIGVIAKGDEVLAYYSTWGRRVWKPLWRMSVHTDPEHQVREGILSVSLRSNTKPLQRSRVNWKFRKDRRHPRGWRADEIARAACKRFGIAVGRIARGRHRITRLSDKRASVVDIVTRVYKIERREMGERFIIDLSKGYLEVLPMRHPRYMHVLGPAILDATIKHSLKGFATTLIVVGTVKNHRGRTSKKVRVRVTDRKRRRQYGEIVKTVKKNGLGSRTALKKWATRELARIHRPREDITFTHPGLPWLDRGDAIRLYLPEDELLVTCYVKAVRHTLSAGTYEMEVTVGFTDPWIDERQRRRDRKRAAAARRRRRRSRGDTHPPKDKRAARRGDHAGAAA